MTCRAYKNNNGEYLDSCYVIFNKELDNTYENDWNMDQQEYYKRILKENQYIASQDFDSYK
jgi:hypothetical protein